jgi:hypothetical protein
VCKDDYAAGNATEDYVFCSAVDRYVTDCGACLAVPV